MKSQMLLIFGSSVAALAGSPWPELGGAVQAVKAVDREGAGHGAATAAMGQLSAAKPGELTEILAGMDDANPLAANWLRAAVETVADRAAADGELPVEALTAFLSDRTHGAAARLLSYELIKAKAPEGLPGLYPMLAQDPVAALRIDPVAALMAEAEGAEGGAAKALYQRALEAARDQEQIDAIAKALGELGVKVDLPKQFGFVMDWHLIAPFSNAGREGFDTVFPPEQGVDLKAVYEGKGMEAKWVPFTSDDDYGMVDFNKPFDLLKEVTGYAVADFQSAGEQDVEIRLGCKNAWKVWLNGELLFARDEYHRGMKLDQYVMPCRLKKGSNQILVKCCQNEQTETWTSEWQFQLRLCDATGTAIAEAQ